MKILGEFGHQRVDVAFSFLCILSALLSLLGVYHHQVVTSIIPSVPITLEVPLYMSGFFMGMVAWAGIFKRFGLHFPLYFLLSFLTSHCIFIGLKFLPAEISRAYFIVYGVMGLAYAAKSIRHNLSLPLALYASAGIVFVCFCWLAVASALLGLPHANHFSVFASARLPEVSSIDVLHQASYMQLIHNFNVPSVGINGLGYHNYHWLFAYPFSTLIKTSGLPFHLVHGDLLPGFSSPVLLNGVMTGFLVGCGRVRGFVMTLLAFAALYGAAVLSMPLINHALLLISPSSAYSMALIAPLLGFFVWVFSGNISQLKAWHFLILGVLVVLIGLAKVNTVFMGSIAFGGLCLPFVLLKKTSWLARGAVTIIAAVTALIVLYLIWEIRQHGRLGGPTPQGYLDMVNALPLEEQQALKADVFASMDPVSARVRQSLKGFEKGSFWKRWVGLVGIGLSTLLPFLLLVPRQGRRHALQYLAGVSLAASSIFVLVWVVWVLPRPTQAIYIMAGPLLLALIIFGSVLSRLIDRKLGSLMLGSSGFRTATLALSVVVILASAWPLDHLRKQLSVTAATAAAVWVGKFATFEGKQIIKQSAKKRFSSLHSPPEPNWPTSAPAYWNRWDATYLSEIKNKLREVVRENPRTAVFISGENEFWAHSSNRPATMFWVQATLGVPLYRGKIAFKKKSSTGLDDLPRISYRGRGMSDSSIEAGARIQSASNVYCWRRFEGWQIVRVDGSFLKQC
ncbi:hypothetical protein N9O95_03485 [Alphaproteobacteria bacterium]|nr:hypothetical protein [Alphaproteobacteria bacterium]